MRRLIFLLAALLVLAASAAWAKPKGCFTKAEHTAEQDVRHGLRLRETSARCRGDDPALEQKWLQIDEAIGTRFASATDRRQKAFEREFPSNAAAYRGVWDGRIVMFFRTYPITPGYCRHLGEQMDEILKRGWKAFQKQASLLRNEVRMDYAVCD